MFALCAGCAHHPDPVQHPPLWRQGMPRDVVPARVLSQRQQLRTRPCGVLAVCWRCRSHGAGAGRLGVRLGDGLNRSCENPLLCSGGRLLGVLLSARSRASGASRTGLRARVCWLPPTQRALCWESGVAVLSDDDELPGRRQLPIAQRSERHAFAALVASAGGGAAGRSVEERGTWRLFSLTLRCLSCLRVACWPGLCVCARAVCLCVRCVRVRACVRVLSVCLCVCLSVCLGPGAFVFSSTGPHGCFHRVDGDTAAELPRPSRSDGSFLAAVLPLALWPLRGTVLPCCAGGSARARWCLFVFVCVRVGGAGRACSLPGHVRVG